MSDKKKVRIHLHVDRNLFDGNGKPHKAYKKGSHEVDEEVLAHWFTQNELKAGRLSLASDDANAANKGAAEVSKKLKDAHEKLASEHKQLKDDHAKLQEAHDKLKEELKTANELLAEAGAESGKGKGKKGAA